MTQYNDFANAIRKRRKERRQTLAALSDATGISIPYLSELERGTKQPPLGDVLDALASELELDRKELGELAFQSRKSVEFEIRGASPSKQELAFFLARREGDGGITDEEAQQLVQMIEERRRSGL